MPWWQALVASTMPGQRTLYSHVEEFIVPSFFIEVGQNRFLHFNFIFEKKTRILKWIQGTNVKRKQIGATIVKMHSSHNSWKSLYLVQRNKWRRRRKDCVTIINYIKIITVKRSMPNYRSIITSELQKCYSILLIIHS